MLPLAGRKPRFFYGWVVVATAFVSMALGYGAMNGFAIFIMPLVNEFGWSRASTSLAFSIFTAVYGFNSPLIGMALDRYGPRVVIPIGATILGLGLIGSSLIVEQWQLYLSYGLFVGIGLGCLGAMVNGSIIAGWFSRQRGLATGIAVSGIGIGMLVLIPLLQMIIDKSGWRAAYLTYGLIILAILPAAAIIFHRHRPEDLGLLPDGGPQPAGAKRPAREMKILDERWAARSWSARSAASTGRFWFLFLASLFACMAAQVFFVHQAACIIGHGFEPMVAATVVASVGLFTSIGKIIWGIVSDRIGRESTFTAGICVLILAAGILSSVTDTSQHWQIYLYGIVFGLGDGVIGPMLPAAAADLFIGKRFSSIYGLLWMAIGIGSTISAWGAGLIFDLTGSYNFAFAAAGCCAALAVVMYWLAAPRRVRLVPGRAR